MTNQSSDSDIFYPEERIKELKLRTQQRNNFEEELFRDSFPTKKELAYQKELLGETQPPFSTLEPKIRRSDPWSLKIPCAIGTVYTGHAYIDLQSPINIMSRAYYNKIKEKPFQAQDLGSIIDSGLSEVVLGKPFAQTSKLTYDESLGLIRFAQKDDEVVFRMPQRTKELDLTVETASRLTRDTVTTTPVNGGQIFLTGVNAQVLYLSCDYKLYLIEESLEAA
ncbi:hypothetical protein Tco_0157700 [Tanacetum coccineum]